ncbi:armadillo repeat-containing protein 10 isoform X1 [Patella vulgata]|uniref:armadillo repeat-containing protein 10 isoform X1 n=1 Tax=Patella vulgata TaxID=6465 RepID=UPI00218011EF|nr:armadillo repeat-containing protein 10 isoform X1 [Patella vulgata]
MNDCRSQQTTKIETNTCRNMAAKDISKIVLAGSAVCGILVLFYIYKRRSKSQEKDVSSTTKPSLEGKSTVKSDVDVKKPDIKLDVPKTSPTPKPESKIPQKIPTKVQQTKPTETKQPTSESKLPTASSPTKDVRAGGEPASKDATVIKDQTAVNQSSPVPQSEASNNRTEPQEIKEEQVVTNEAPPVPKSEASNNRTEPQEIKEEQVVTNEAPPQSSQNIPVVESKRPEEEKPEPVKSNEASQAPAADLEQDTIKSQASIVLTPKPAEDAAPIQNGTESSQSTRSSSTVLDVEKITKAIQQAKNTPNNIDKETVETLVSLLKQKDIELLQAALDSIVRLGAFSQNQILLRESGCIQELTLLLQVHATTARLGVQTSQNLLGPINNVIINMCMDIQNQARLEVCIPVLIDLITYEKSPDDVQLMSLKSLTNLSTTPSYHEQYIPALPRLFQMMDGNNTSIRLQAVKVLVNLSCNPEVLPDLLESKTPSSLFKYLEAQTDSILLLRVITLLVNMVSGVKEGKITETRLPSENNPANPQSLYTALFDSSNAEEIKRRVQGLCRHQTENVSKQAIRLFELIK